MGTAGGGIKSGGSTPLSISAGSTPQPKAPSGNITPPIKNPSTGSAPNPPPTKPSPGNTTINNTTNSNNTNTNTTNNTASSGTDKDKDKKSTLGRIASGAGKGALLAAGAAGAVGGAALNGLRNAGRAIGGPGSGGTGDTSYDEGGLVLIFWLAALIQFIDIMTGSQRPGLVLSAYTVLVILSIIFVFKRDRADEAGLIVAVVAAYFLPWLTKLNTFVSIASSSTLVLLLSGLIVLIPIVPLYIALKFPDHTLAKTWAKWVIGFWILVFALFLMVTFMPDQNSKVLINNPMAGVKYVLGEVGKVFGKVSTSIDKTFERAVAQATGQPYGGEEESKVGIYVEDVKSLESTYNTNSRIFVEAKIKATNVKEKMNINTICYIENVKQGTVNPTILYDVIGEYDNIVTCDLGQLKEGTYEVKVRANFEFETTSDIEYTFVGSDIKSDQYNKLNINPTTIATYTGGPVALGLPSLTQPLRIDLNRINRSTDTLINTQLSSYPFGVSLQNQWPQGKVIRGLKYILNTPKEITLVSCTREPQIALEPDPALDRNTYTFVINTSNAQDVFDAVTCRQNVADVKALLGNDLKSVKTFAARSRYEYAVEGTTTIIVEKNTDTWAP